MMSIRNITSDESEIVTETEDTREARHVEVYRHIVTRLDDVLKRLEALAGQIAQEPMKEPTRESDDPTPIISLQDFIRSATDEKVDYFADEATNQITRIREMLF